MVRIAFVVAGLAASSMAAPPPAPDRPLAPPEPHDLTCNSGAKSGSVQATCMTDATVTDKVDFGVARADDPQSWAAVHYVALVEKDGSARATIPGLKAGVSYKISARAHHKDSSEGWNEKWSAVASETAECSAATLDKNETNSIDLHDRDRNRDRDGEIATSWVTMYRFRGPGFGGPHPKIQDFNLPDFLDGHDSADAYEQLGRWNFEASCPSDWNYQCGVTRYCVEILNVDLVVPVHAVGIGGPTRKSENFANYVPCDGGKCHCPNKFDSFTLEGELETPRDWVDKSCPRVGNCQCDEESIRLSNNYTGRWTFYPPFSNQAYMDGQGNPQGGFYAGKKHEASPYGYYYSSPEAGRCADNVEVGTNGCTWKRSPLMHTLSVRQLLDGGVYGGSPSYRHISTAEETSSKEIAEKMYESIGAPPCGPLSTTAAYGLVV